MPKNKMELSARQGLASGLLSMMDAAQNGRTPPAYFARCAITYMDDVLGTMDEESEFEEWRATLELWVQRN